MSFRELRGLADHLRTLGYPRPVSTESFRIPNFELVAHILYWLTMRYSPSAKLNFSISTEKERTTFLSAAAQILLTEGNIFLKTTNLYAADGKAVKELLKVSKSLYLSLNIARRMGDDEYASNMNDILKNSSLLESKSSEFLSVRKLTQEISDLGTKLHELLAHDSLISDAHARAMHFVTLLGRSGGSEAHSIVSEVLEDSTRKSQARSEVLEAHLKELSDDASTLETKLQRRRADLERGKTRLDSMMSVKPSYQAEYEQLEIKLQAEYAQYVINYRNLCYLESELANYAEKEAQRLMASQRKVKKLQSKLQEEESRLERGEDIEREKRFERRPQKGALSHPGSIGDSNGDSHFVENQKDIPTSFIRPSSRSGSRAGIRPTVPMGRPRSDAASTLVFGSMNGADDDDDETSDIERDVAMIPTDDEDNNDF